jgi:hypothetical protein
MATPATSVPRLTRRQLETALIEKCWKDPAFRREIVTDPRGTVQKYTGQKCPEGVSIYVHEEDGNTIHLSIPPAPSNLTELSDEDLERVAGGTDVAFTMAIVSLVATVAGTGAAAAGTNQIGW